MQKKIVASLLLLGLLGMALILIIPQINAQQYGPQQTDIERLQRELGQKIDSLAKSIDNLQRTLDLVKRKLDEVDRKIK